jgi:hypothetical protein
MNDAHAQPNADAESDEQPSVRLRKRWHAPQFMLTDVSLTDAQGNLVSDGSFGQS